MVALALVVWFAVANRPEDVGLLPDNEPAPVSAEPAPKASSLTNGQIDENERYLAYGCVYRHDLHYVGWRS